MSRCPWGSSPSARPGRGRSELGERIHHRQRQIQDVFLKKSEKFSEGRERGNTAPCGLLLEGEVIGNWCSLRANLNQGGGHLMRSGCFRRWRRVDHYLELLPPNLLVLNHIFSSLNKQTNKWETRNLPCPCLQNQTSPLPPLGQLVQADSKKIFTFFKFYQNLKSRLMQCKDFNLYQKQVPQKLWMNFTFLFFVTSLFARYPLKIVSQVGLDRHFMFYPFLITGSSGPVWYWAGWIFRQFIFSLLLPLPFFLLLFLLLPIPFLLLIVEKRPHPLFD